MWTKLLTIVPWESLLIAVAKRAAALAADHYADLLAKAKSIDESDLSNEAKKAELKASLPSAYPGWAKNLIVELLVAHLRLSR